MADFKFACPGCGQHIVCDEMWGGRQMQCPACHCELIVPQTQPAVAQVASLLPPSPGSASPPSLIPKPPAGAQARLSTSKPTGNAPAGAPQQARPPAGPTPSPQPSRYTPPPIRKPEEKKTSIGKILAFAGVFIVFAVGGYFGFMWVSKAQDKTNEKRREMERNSDGGEMGHIANLYDVLDATEPGGRGLGGGARSSGPRTRSTTGMREIDVPGEGYKSPMEANQAMSIVPATYTLEADAAKIPDGRVNGKVAGTNFVLDIARLDRNATGYVLSLRQGTNASPDKEILVFLHLGPGEKISGHTWTITKDMKEKTVPQVMKRWKPNPKFAPQQKAFANGYVMKLEFAQIDYEEVSGKVFIALPDPEQSFIGGNFKADTTVFEMRERGTAAVISALGTNAAPSSTTTNKPTPAATTTNKPPAKTAMKK